LLAKAIRFGFVGVMSGAVFSLVTVLLVAGWGVGAVAASILGYCVSIPASFLGHRQYSFRSRGFWATEAGRFVGVQLFNIAVTAGAMYGAVDYFRTGYAWGMAAAVILVPMVNFAFANLWIFRKQGFD
jgi:putative flippase GtrA